VPNQPEAAREDPSSPPAEDSQPKPPALAFPKLSTKPKDRNNDATSPTEKSPTSEGEGPSSPGKMRNWLKNRFSRPRAKSSSAAMDDGSAGADTGKTINTKRGFIGGVTLTKMRDHNASTSSVDNRSASMREVAMAGRGAQAKDASAVGGEDEDGGVRGTSRLAKLEPQEEEAGPSNAPGSSASSVASDGDRFSEAQSHLSAANMTLPPAIRVLATGRGSPVRESKFSEIIE
jgi:hypothetical protein